jgi:hypothetical protein
MRLFALLMLTAALACHADPTVRALLPANGVTEASLIETPAGEMLVLVVDGPRAGLYRAPDGAIKERVMAPDNLEAVWPVGAGFIGTRIEGAPRSFPGKAAEHRQVVRFDGLSSDSRVLYETAQRAVELLIEPVPDADAFYVLENTAQRYNVRRIAGSGELEWEYDLGETSYADMLAIPGGVLLRRQMAPGRWSIAAFDDVGDMSWQTSDKKVARSRAAFIGPTRAAVPLELPAPGSHFAIIDVRNGKELTRQTVLTGSSLLSTHDGLLLTEVALGQPYAALFHADGTRSWWRRLPIDFRPSILLDTTITRRGELWMLGKPFGSPLEGTNQLLLLRTSAANPARPAVCLDVDPNEVAALAIDLMTRHGALILLGIGSSSGPAPCPMASDVQRLEFLRQFAAVLGEQPTITRPATPSQPRIVLRVDGKSRPYERVAYSDDNGRRACDPGKCPPSAVVYAANSNAGREFGTFLRQQLVPHLDRLEQLRAEFKALTGEDFMARDGFVMRAGQLELLNDVDLFTTLEKNAATLLREVQRLPAATLEQYRADADHSMRHLVLTPDAFGDQFALQPISEIGATLQRLYATW